MCLCIIKQLVKGMQLLLSIAQELYTPGRAVYRIFAKGGRTWSMSKRGGARLFVAAGHLQHKIFTYLRSIYMSCDML